MALDTPSSLLVFRPEAVRLILDGDPAFYRPHGEDDHAAIRRAVAAGQMGELAGYGARSMQEPDLVRVTVHTADSELVFMNFFTQRAHAAIYAQARMQDLAEYLQIPLSYTID